MQGAPVGVGIQGIKVVQGSRVQEGFNARTVAEELGDGHGALAVPIVGELDPLLAAGGQISRPAATQFVLSRALGFGHCFASPSPPNPVDAVEDRIPGWNSDT